MRRLERDDDVFEAMGLDLSAPAELSEYFNFRCGHLIIKNEAGRFGLGSFKALGGYYASAFMLAKYRATCSQGAEYSYASPFNEVEQVRAPIILVTASAGNHGIGIAAAAARLGVTARVFLPSTAPAQFTEKLNELGAISVVCDLDYDGTVERARSYAELHRCLYLPDTSDEAGNEVVHRVMEGYTRIADELEWEFRASTNWPSDVFLQAGVGTFATAMAQKIRASWPMQPAIHIVEADKAACLAYAAGKADRKPDASAISVMHRLDCKIPSAIAVDRLSKLDVNYVQITDQDALIARQKLRSIGQATSASGAAGMAGYLKVCGCRPADRRSLIILTEQDQFRS